MDPYRIIKKYYDPKSKAYKRLITHGKIITKISLKLAKKVEHLKPDIKFIKEAAILHDIGMYKCDAPTLNCYGKEPYIKHGVIGRKILEKENLPIHAKVCERHIGVGITKKEIIRNKLPLPKRNMIPISIEERIIAYADKFHTKDKGINSIPFIRKRISKYGKENLKRFDELHKLFKN
ncbi:HD domain-containing protein [Nanoarchaeota archaeon]